jgi:23S rRNA U2552 (ribose-2'-O)-methylase RlmE/FtsJ
MYDIKHEIHKYKNDWDIYKKYTNPYEYINTYIPNCKSTCVADYKPLSRSYFKMIEILFQFKLNDDTTVPMKSFHLAEGPGGFIEAIVNYRKLWNSTQREKSLEEQNDKYIGMTLLPLPNILNTDANIPTWKKSERFLKNNPNVFIENGKDGTGNIISYENFIHCKEKYGSTMDLITADGGFDFSNDFNSQEFNVLKLLFSQIAFALCMQRKHGNFIIKIFDCYMQQTMDLLYILTSFYENVYITKPLTSRIANSEKYIVCINFQYDNCNTFFPFLQNAFQRMICGMEKNTTRFLHIPTSLFFNTKLEEYNAIFGKQQIENIHNTILLMDNKNKTNKIDNMIKTNIQKCIIWCKKYGVKHLETNAIF